MKENKLLYTVEGKVQETYNVVTLKLSCNKGISTHKSGQFINIFFDDLGNGEGKSYTISSAPFEEVFTITVKGVGNFSNRLCSLNIGDSFEASIPYGYFYSEEENTALIMIAGGIGITPFRSMIMESLMKEEKRRVFLFYSNKTVNDIVFHNEFEKTQQENNFFTMKNYITQQEMIPNEMKRGRITVNDVVDETRSIKNKEFLICGSIPFVRDFWKSLKESGIPEEIIYTEAFF